MYHHHNLSTLVDATKIAMTARSTQVIRQKVKEILKGREGLILLVLGKFCRHRNAGFFRFNGPTAIEFRVDFVLCKG